MHIVEAIAPARLGKNLVTRVSLRTPEDPGEFTLADDIIDVDEGEKKAVLHVRRVHGSQGCVSLPGSLAILP